MNQAQMLGRLMFAAAACVGLLPLWLQRGLGSLAGRIAHALNTRETKVARRNLEIIAPELSATQRERRVDAILRNTGRNGQDVVPQESLGLMYVDIHGARLNRAWGRSSGY